METLKIDRDSKTITIPIGTEPAVVLIDPKEGTARLVPLVEHGDIVVKCYQGRIAGLDERKSHRF